MRKTVRLADGCVFTGEIVDGIRNGKGKKTYPNGATYEGYWLNDVRHGIGIKTHADGVTKAIMYEHGKLI